MPVVLLPILIGTAVGYTLGSLSILLGIPYNKNHNLKSGNTEDRGFACIKPEHWTFTGIWTPAGALLSTGLDFWETSRQGPPCVSPTRKAFDNESKTHTPVTQTNLAGEPSTNCSTWMMAHSFCYMVGGLSGLVGRLIHKNVNNDMNLKSGNTEPTYLFQACDNFNEVKACMDDMKARSLKCKQMCYKDKNCLERAKPKCKKDPSVNGLLMKYAKFRKQLLDDLQTCLQPKKRSLESQVNIFPSNVSNNVTSIIQCMEAGTVQDRCSKIIEDCDKIKNCPTKSKLEDVANQTGSYFKKWFEAWKNCNG